MELKELSIDNFYVDDYPGPDGSGFQRIGHLHKYLSWVGGYAYYGYENGNPMRWLYDSPPKHLVHVTDFKLAEKFAAEIEIRDARKQIIQHLDAIKRLGDKIKKHHNI